LNKKSLGYLGADSLEKRKRALVVNDISHNLDKALERLSLTTGRWA
jgi:hypothetical protein